MKQIDIQKIENRELYLEKDIDTDGSIYLKQKRDIKEDYPLFIENIFKEYENQIEKIIKKQKLTWYYIIGYYLYFTFNNKKYYYIFSHQSTNCKEYYVRKLIYTLRKQKCSKFYFKEGHAD